MYQSKGSYMAVQVYTSAQDIDFQDNHSKNLALIDKHQQQNPLIFPPTKKQDQPCGQPCRFSSPGQFLFYRRVRTVTRHLRPVSFYFTDESEPSLVIFSEVRKTFPLFIHIITYFNSKCNLNLQIAIIIKKARSQAAGKL